MPMPSKETTERLAPWFTLGVAIIAGLLAWLEYREHIDARRTDKTLEYVERYQKDPIFKASNELRIIMLHETETKNSGFRKITKKIKSSMTPGERTAIRKEIFSYMVNLVEKKKMQKYVMIMLDFYTTLSICASKNICSPNLVSSYFGKDLIGFINGYCPYLKKLESTWKRAFGKEITVFLKSRGHTKFFCGY
ncbi:MAG: hypothetical protein QF797_12415 [Alphaproteobacteria bacterium]|nr:hypothetical protein [Alphaproteobacteria bacterium]MDP6621934.1 hypothetical protein [Alphaproteobacteria bacterium]